MEHPGVLWRRGQGLREEGGRASDGGGWDCGWGWGSCGSRGQSGQQGRHALCGASASTSTSGTGDSDADGSGNGVESRLAHAFCDTDCQCRSQGGWRSRRISTAPAKASQRAHCPGRDELARTVARLPLWRALIAHIVHHRCPTSLVWIRRMQFTACFSAWIGVKRLWTIVREAGDVLRKRKFQGESKIVNHAARSRRIAGEGPIPRSAARSLPKA